MHNFRVIPKYGCDEYSAPASAADLHVNASVDVYIGTSCADGMVQEALLATTWNMPTITYFATSDALRDKSRFQTLARVSETQVSTHAASILLNRLNPAPLVG